ncbi:MAG TPA: uroporphyrinogen decarboxylase [Mycobacteriales bacterium]
MSSFLAACHREPVDRTPVWFMRQAGRALPEYRALRAGVPMLEACRNPDLVTEITLQPVRRYDVDAAILFSDIVVPLHAAGVDLDLVPGVGPVIAAPIRSAADVTTLPRLDAAVVDDIADACRMLVRELGDIPLIGFAGAPFTLASYLIEGGPSRDLTRTKALMYGEPAVWAALMEALVELAGTFLRVQVDAGASAVQLFDSWVGSLPLTAYLEHVQPWSAQVLAMVPDVPRIHFGVGTGELLAAIGEAGATVVGVDWRVPLDEATRRIGPSRAVQGNLDPAILFAPWPVVEGAVRDVLAAGRAAPGHIFNLGHGVLPDTDPGVLTEVARVVHEASGSQALRS